MGFIYKITNPINMIYVGQTVALRKRLIAYSRYAFENKHKGIVNDSFLTFGFEAHVFQILEMNVPIDKLSERELYWIGKLNSLSDFNTAGMNVSKANGGTYKKVKDPDNIKDFFEGFEQWDFVPFTGAEFMQKTRRLRSEYTSYINKKYNKNFPQWASEKCWADLKKKIISYDPNGDFIAEYDSATDAAKMLDIPRSSIKDSLRTCSWSRGKYMFKYWEENYPKKIPISKVTYKGGLKPVYLLNNNWEIIKEYDSPISAASAVGGSAVHVRRLAAEKGLKMFKKSYRFVYKEDYDSLKPSETGGGDRPLI